MQSKLRNPLFYIFITSPVVLWLLILLLPTFDDWTYITTPNGGLLGDDFATFLRPFWSYWRPFDALTGYFLKHHYSLFPAFNHVLVYLAHLGSTYCVYRIIDNIGASHFSRNIATIFFYLSPAVLGTVFGIDSINQAQSHFWGILALYVYLLNKDDRRKKHLYIILVIIATFFKENGMAFLAAIPLFAHGFDRITRREMIKLWMIGGAVIAIYFAVRLSLTIDMAEINNAYFENTLASKLKHLAMFIGYPFFSLDYVSVFYPPTKNLFIAAITALLAFPFTLVLIYFNRNQLFNKRIIVCVACWIILASPHLLTLFTTMHAYAGHSMAAITIALLIEKTTEKQRRVVLCTFMAYLVSVLYIDYHHWIMSYRSGLTGKAMGEMAIRKTGTPQQRVFTITIDHNETKYSSFCVIPVYAFGWGNAAKHATHYQWPTEMEDSTIFENQIGNIPNIVNHAFNKGYPCVWIVERSDVKVVKQNVDP